MGGTSETAPELGEPLRARTLSGLHDLNNLLQPILGYADLLADELPAGDPRRGWADEIRQAAAQARALVDELHRALRSGSPPSA